MTLEKQKQWLVTFTIFWNKKNKQNMQNGNPGLVYNDVWLAF